MFDLKTEDWLEGLGEPVFFEMACDYLGYNTFLSEVHFADAIRISAKQTMVTLLVSEVGKTPQKVKFKIQLET